MVLDGIYYALALAGAGALIAGLVSPWLAAPLFLLALFCLYFFRDPDRAIPAGDHLAVSPADGKVVSVKADDPSRQTRVSIFLNVFDVHVNRTPVGGRIVRIHYQPGKFLVASKEAASSDNEQNTIEVESPNGTHVVFSQIAGLIARRIVCWKQVGDEVAAGERIGLIKFGSRVDVWFGPEWAIDVQVGQRVSAGSSVLAHRRAG
jgi:phosphatidylserine decarboxylase